MNIQRQTNTFNKGMNMDLDYSVMDSQQYRYAENIRIITNDNGSTGVMQNIEGVIKTTPTMQITGETIIHVMTIRDWAIVFTKTKDNTNSIYRYDFSKSDEFPTVTKVLDSVELNITPIDGIYTISSVGRWESEDNVKIYWCDGNNQIRVLNVDDAHDNSNLTANTLNILPESILPPVEFQGIGTGSLKTGKYQYCYQLFNPRSSETAISALSPMFTITKRGNKSNSKDVIGDEKEANTGKSIKFGTTLLSNAFTKAKIIQIYYKDNTSVPVVTVIDDISIYGNQLSYEDKGGTVIDEMTIDEFNSLTGYNFIPKVLESKDNRLFAANVKEATWDIDDKIFDCRAYRCNANGEVKLISNSGQSDIEFNINDIPTDIPFDHDCICPYNSMEMTVTGFNDYKYAPTDTGSFVQGGKGLNISYEFVVTDLIEDDEQLTVSDKLPDNWNLGCNSYDFDSLPIYSLRGGSRTVVDTIKFSAGKHIPNYSNSEIESKLQGYHRDEIYRFAIVFYNKTNTPSSAHWIADIRMPKASDDNYNFFSCGAKVTLGENQTNNNVLVTHPLGIRFSVQNIPTNQDITGFEIVRCERTIQDRTILTQGIVSGLIQHKNEQGTLLPFPYLSFASNHALTSMSDDYRYTWDYGKYQSDEYFRFISPEICVNRENSTEILDMATDLLQVCTLKSDFDPSANMGDGTKFDKTSHSGTNKFKALSAAASIKTLKDVYDGDTIVTSEGTIKDVHNQNWNKDDGWLYDYVKVNSTDDGEITGDVDCAIRIDGSTIAYNAVLAKYYLPTYNKNYQLNPVNVEDIAYASSYDPFDLDEDAWRTKGIAIGNKTYYNWCWDTNTTAGNQGAGIDTTHNNNMRKAGPHGLCAVIRSKDIQTAGNMGFIYSNGSNLADAMSVVLCNLRKASTPYGGQTYATRQNSVYIGTGNYVALDGNSGVKTCYGGDTYLGVLDYATCMFSYEKDDYKPDASRNKAYVGAYIPCESSVNLSLRSDDFQVSKTFEPNGYANHLVQNEITSIGTLYTQSKPLYAYNDAYSVQPRSKVFVSKSIYDIDNLHTDTRVISSEVKTNNELSDSWTKFKVANYIDVDTRFGSINNMKLFQNQLLFWQTDAFGTLAVNERSLITDNNIGALTLGTGDILARYDYISLKNGSKENQLRAATQSDSTVYWYDYDRNEICSFGNGMNYVSKLKGVQSYLNGNKSSFTLDPKTVYDKKYNEALFTLEDKTLVYNEQMGAFSAFYTFSPSWWAEFSDKLYAFNSLNCFKYNAGDEADLFTGEDKVSYIQFVVNDGYPQTKTFDNVEYSGDFTHGTNFNDIYFDTKRQRSSSLTDKDIDYREDTYKFCIPRNSLELSEIGKLVNKSYKDRMKGKYLVCHYKYNCNGGNTFEVPYISTAYRPSMI